MTRIRADIAREPWFALVVTGAALAWIILLDAGHPGPAWSILAGGALAVFMRSRLAGPRLVRVEESVALPVERQTVWSLVDPPENAPLITDDIRNGYRVPGSGVGVGERRAYEMSDGWTLVVEVVELVAEHRVVARLVSPPDTVVRFTDEVIDAPDRPGCVLRWVVEVELPAGWYNARLAKTVRASVLASFERIRSQLDGVGPTAPPTIPPESA